MAVGVPDPGLFRCGAGDPHPCDVGLGELAGPGVHPDVAVEVEEPDGVRAGQDVMAAEGGLELRALVLSCELSELAAQRLDLRGPIQPEQPAKVRRPQAGRALRAGLPEQRHEQRHQRRRPQPVEPLAHRGEHFLDDTERPRHLQRR